MSSIDFNCPTAYNKFALQGFIVKTKGSHSPIKAETASRSDLVAVAVRAIILTFGGRILLISPSLLNDILNVYPLAIYIE